MQQTVAARLAVLSIVLPLLTIPVSSVADDEERLLEHFISRTAFRTDNNPEFSIRVLKADVTGDGKEDYLMGSHEGSSNAPPDDNNFSYVLFVTHPIYNKQWDAGILSWDRDKPAFLLPSLGDINRPVVLAPFRANRKEGSRWGYFVYVCYDERSRAFSRLDILFPDKTPQELDSMFDELAKKGKRLDTFHTYRVRDLAKRYVIMTKKSFDTGKGDPGYRMIGPNLPASGEALTTEEVRSAFVGTRDLRGLPRLSHYVTSATLSALPPLESLRSDAPTTSTRPVSPGPPARPVPPPRAPVSVPTPPPRPTPPPVPTPPPR